MTIQQLIKGAAASAVCLSLVACGQGGAPNAGGATKANGAAITLNGAGSTFVYPAMSQWAFEYPKDHPGVTINYQSVGSGAGIAQFKAGTIDFGATDAPLLAADERDMSTQTLHIPVTAGCVVLSYNLPGIESGLKLSGDVVADIFLGKIKAWNDPRIVQQNAGKSLPETPISVVHRSDGSGTSYVFTGYLADVSPDWKSGPGQGKTVNWPVGVGGKGSEGVAGLIKQTPGSLGYVEYAYALQTKLPVATLRNKAGNYVDPSAASTTAAAEAAADKMKQDVRIPIVNSDAKDAYPIAGYTYVLISKGSKDRARAKAVVEFLRWVLGPGQELAAKLQYAPLPKSVVDLNNKALDSVMTS